MDTPVETTNGKLKRSIKLAAWVFLGIFLLALFTLLKLPDTKIKGYANAQIASMLRSQGITLTHGPTDLDLLPPGYALQDVSLLFRGSTIPLRADELRVSPAVLPLLVGKVGGTATISQPAGTAKVRLLARGSDSDVSLNAKDLDIGKMSATQALAGIKAGALISGTSELQGNLNVPNTLSGDVDLNLRKVTIDQQTFMGFSLPQLNVSEGKIDVKIGNGKAQIQTLKLGKAGSSDDLTLNVTGDIQLGRSIDTSNLNLKINFTLSEKIKKAFVFVDSLIASAKQADGSYAYQITGPASMPMPTPLSK